MVPPTQRGRASNPRSSAPRVGLRLAAAARARGLVALLGLLSAGCAGMQTSVNVALPVASKYVTRGAVWSDRTVLQPEAFVVAESDEQSFTAGVWTNVPTEHADGDEWDVTEADFYADYGRALGDFDLTVGLAHYEFPHTGSAATSEVHAALSYEFAWLTSTLECWYDFVDVDDAYYNLSFSHTRADLHGWQLDLVSGVGYMEAGQAAFNFGVAESGLSDFLAQASLTHSLGARVGLTLTGAFASVLDQDMRDAAADPDVLVVSAGLSFEY